ncbi:extracellular matrix protein 2-like [Discoglossus pictus]
MEHKMNVLFIILLVSFLGFNGWAQKVQEKRNGSTGMWQKAQLGANSKLTPVANMNQTASKQKASGQKKTTVVGQSRSGGINTLTAGGGQCLVNGMAMFDGAAWSPSPCTMCICDRGKQVCEPEECGETPCPAGTLQTPPGGCCPVCVKTDKPQTKMAASTTKLSQVRKTDREEAQKEIKQRKKNEELLKTTPKPVKRLSTTTQVSAITKKPQRTRKESDINKRPQKKTLIKEVHYGKQETVNKKKVLNKAKKESNGKKEKDTGEPKKQAQEKLSKVKPKQRGAVNTTTQHPTVVKEHLEKNKKIDVTDSLLPAPTFPRLGLPVQPTESHIPSLPSGCLLSESAIACGNTGMQYLPLMNDPGLKTLYLAENEISKLPARAFSGLPNLEWLDLSKNKLDDSGLAFDVFKNLTKLKRLNLDGNRLTELPLLPTSLQELKINDNTLQELNRHSFNGLHNLLNLELEGNGFHDGNVYPLTFKPLKKLIYLRLNRNQFRALPSGLPESLQELHLDNNRVEFVPEGILNKTVNLTVLVLSNNRLREDRIAPRAWIHLMNVESLDLSHNHLVHVPSFLPRGLKQLILHHNQIELIPGYVFAHMKPGLEFLHLSHNHLTDDGIHAVSFYGLYKSLNELLLDNNLLQSIPRGILNLKSLQVLRLSFNKIRYVPLDSVCDTRMSVDSNLVSVHLENNLINRRLIPPTAFSCIKSYHSVVLRPQQEEYEDY